MSDSHPEKLEPVSRERLVDAIDFALRHKVGLPMVGPRRARWKDETESKIAAEAIVDQLELSHIVLARPPLPPLRAMGYSPFGPEKATPE